MNEVMIHDHSIGIQILAFPFISYVDFLISLGPSFCSCKKRIV